MFRIERNTIWPIVIPDSAFSGTPPQTPQANAIEVDPAGPTLTLPIAPAINVTISTTNVTGWSLPDGTNNETVSIFFKETGMGGFTLGGNSANILLAGGALALTGTPNKIDVLVLQWNTILSKWVEQSRALNCS